MSQVIVHGEKLRFVGFAKHRRLRRLPVNIHKNAKTTPQMRALICPASAPVRHMWTASWQALLCALNDLVGCGHMSGLVARRICPLALMKSDDRESLSDLRASSSCLTTGCLV